MNHLQFTLCAFVVLFVITLVLLVFIHPPWLRNISTKGKKYDTLRWDLVVSYSILVGLVGATGTLCITKHTPSKSE